MTPLKKRILTGLLTTIIITGLFWAGGFDFDERGATLLIWLFLCVTNSLIAMSFPFEDYDFKDYK